VKKRLHFRPSHRDKAERAIITALRSVGASVYQVNGKDLPDLLCGFRGVTTLMEVKSRLLSEEKDRAPRMRTTAVSEGQKAFAATWQGGLSLVVFNPAMALMAIGAPFEGPAASMTESPRFLAVNGAFLCPECWLPENGLHAKDCPARLALKRPPKVETAHRAAKKARDLLPVPGLPMAPDWMAEAVREHHEELKKAKRYFCVCGHLGSHHARTTERACEDCPCTGYTPSDEPRGVEGELQPLKVKP
jgi:hypothetical protein